MMDDIPFSERSFVSEIVRDSEAMASFPDNRPTEPHVFITRVNNMSREELDDTFHKLHTPWKPQNPQYTVKDWRRSVMFSKLPKSPPIIASQVGSGSTRNATSNSNNSNSNNTSTSNSNSNSNSQDLPITTKKDRL